MNRRANFFCISSHLDRISESDAEKAVSFLDKAGMKGLRNCFAWSIIEPEKGSFDWKRYDRIVEIAEEHGIEILSLIARAPAWASGQVSEDFHVPPPKDLKDYANYTKHLVNHFKDRIKYWEIWNEPNAKSFWPPRPDANEYVKLLKAGYEAAKEADPDCQTLLGGIACHKNSRIDWEFLEGVYENGGGEYFDIMNVHPYSGPNPPEVNFFSEIQKLKELMDKYGGQKPIWITEIGCPVHQRFAANEDIQANHLVRTYILAASVREIERVYWYDFRDDGLDKNEREDNFGLVDYYYRPKLSYKAYGVMTNLLKGLGYKTKLKMKEGIEGYVFSDEKRSVVVLWTVLEKLSLRIKSGPTKMQLIDLEGGKKELVPEGDEVALELTEKPFYIESETTKTDELLEALSAAEILIHV